MDSSQSRQPYVWIRLLDGLLRGDQRLPEREIMSKLRGLTRDSLNSAVLGVAWLFVGDAKPWTCRASTVSDGLAGCCCGVWGPSRRCGVENMGGGVYTKLYVFIFSVRLAVYPGSLAMEFAWQSALWLNWGALWSTDDEC